MTVSDQNDFDLKVIVLDVIEGPRGMLSRRLSVCAWRRIQYEWYRPSGPTLRFEQSTVFLRKDILRIAQIEMENLVASHPNGIETLRRIDGLLASLFTRDAKLLFTAFEQLEVGGVIAGDMSSFRIDHVPYGGIKEFGMGGEGLRYAIEEMTEPRILVLNLRKRRAIVAT